MAQLTYTVPVIGSTDWGTALNDILTEIKTKYNDLEATGVDSKIDAKIAARFVTVSALPASPDANTYYYVTG